MFSSRGGFRPGSQGVELEALTLLLCTLGRGYGLHPGLDSCLHVQAVHLVALQLFQSSLDLHSYF